MRRLYAIVSTLELAVGDIVDFRPCVGPYIWKVDTIEPLPDARIRITWTAVPELNSGVRKPDWAGEYEPTHRWRRLPEVARKVGA